MSDEILNPFGGDKGRDMKTVGIPYTPEERQQFFKEDYNTIFGNLPQFKSSLSGFYGGMPFEAYRDNLAKVAYFNRHPPRTKRVPEQEGGGGMFGGLPGMGGGMPQLPGMGGGFPFNPFGGGFSLF